MISDKMVGMIDEKPLNEMSSMYHNKIVLVGLKLINNENIGPIVHNAWKHPLVPLYYYGPHKDNELEVKANANFFSRLNQEIEKL